MDRAEGMMDITASMIDEFFAKFIEMMDDSSHGSCKAVGELLGYDERKISFMRSHLRALGRIKYEPESANILNPLPEDRITEDGLLEARKRGYLIGIRDFSGTKLRTATCNKCCARHVLVRSIPSPRMGNRGDFGSAIREDAERHRKRIIEVRELVKPEGYEVVDCHGAVDSFRCHRCKCEIELPEGFWRRNTE